MASKKKTSFISQLHEYARESSERRIKNDFYAYENMDEVFSARCETFKYLSNLRKSKLGDAKCRRGTSFTICDKTPLIGCTDGTIYNTATEKRTIVGEFPIVNFNDVFILARNGGLHSSEHICNEICKSTEDATIEEIFLKAQRKVCFTELNSAIELSKYHKGLNLLVYVDIHNTLYSFDLNSMMPVFKTGIETLSLDIHPDGNIFLFHNRLVDLRSMKSIFEFSNKSTRSKFLGGKNIVFDEWNVLKSFCLRTMRVDGNILAHTSSIIGIECFNESIVSASTNNQICISSPQLSIIHLIDKIEEGVQKISADCNSVYILSESNEIFRLGI